jgi:D-ornithine 4,5-aminomutase subunit beta
VDTAKQALVGMDGLQDLVAVKEDGELAERKRELIERAVLFLEEIDALGGYFEAVARGYFVDSGYYPERNGDGIGRDPEGGVAAGSVVPRARDYLAPVCEHFGYNNLPEGIDKPCELIGGCTLCNPELIRYIDELDPEDNVHHRLEKTAELRTSGALKPEVQWFGDGVITLNMLLPADQKTAHYAALEIAARLGLENAEVIHQNVMHPAEGTYVELKGEVPFTVDPKELVIPETEELLSADEIDAALNEQPMTIVAATVGEDEHSVGMREIIDIKHGGLERYGINCEYLGTSVPIEKAVDAAIEIDADAILISTIITHADIHRLNMQRLDQLCREKGIREKLLLIGGGTQLTDDIAKECGLDAGFGPKTTGHDVASFLIRARRERSWR